MWIALCLYALFQPIVQCEAEVVRGVLWKKKIHRICLHSKIIEPYLSWS